MTELSKMIIRIFGAIGAIVLAAGYVYTAIKQGEEPGRAAIILTVFLMMWDMLVLAFIHMKD